MATDSRLAEIESRASLCEAQSSVGPAAYVVLNPKSFRASVGDLAAQARQVALARGAEIIEASEPSRMIAALDQAMAGRASTIAVLSGDGTVQAIADHLAREPDPLRRPALLVLAGGRTNLIASDLGGRGKVLQKLDTYLANLRRGVTIRIHERPTLVVEQHPAPPRHGFFLAGAQLDSIIRACHAHREVTGKVLRAGHLSAPYCVTKLALARIAGRRLLPTRPHLDVAAPGLGHLSASTRLLAVSTLSYANALINPFAQRGEGELRVTAVSGNADAFWWRLARVLLGRFSAQMNPQSGYLSGRCERIEVIGLERYTLDGEKFECDPRRRVIMRVGPSLRFVVS